ncbi:MAG: hypothetical protein LBG99_04380 [Propionibacteriaceae bacterium]|nr:hypothetical protein [Propionibacteriaceae bacterium]
MDLEDSGMHDKFAEGSSQQTLLIRRLEAFGMASTLISRELDRSTGVPYSRGQLTRALKSLDSTVSKLSKIPEKLTQGTS